MGTSYDAKWKKLCDILARPVTEDDIAKAIIDLDELKKNNVVLKDIKNIKDKFSKLHKTVVMGLVPVEIRFFITTMPCNPHFVYVNPIYGKHSGGPLGQRMPWDVRWVEYDVTDFYHKYNGCRMALAKMGECFELDDERVFADLVLEEKVSLFIEKNKHIRRLH